MGEGRSRKHEQAAVRSPSHDLYPTRSSGAGDARPDDRICNGVISGERQGAGWYPLGEHHADRTRLSAAPANAHQMRILLVRGPRPRLRDRIGGRGSDLLGEADAARAYADQI